MRVTSTRESDVKMGKKNWNNATSEKRGNVKLQRRGPRRMPDAREEPSQDSVELRREKRATSKPMKNVARAKRGKGARTGRRARPQVALEKGGKATRGVRERRAKARPVVETGVPQVDTTANHKVEGELKPGDTVVIRERVAPPQSRPAPI
jgi:hypothetical protein